MDIYKWADDSINVCPRYETGFSLLLSTQPYRISSAVRRGYEDRLKLIHTFQQTALDLFRAAINNDVHPDIVRWLFNETPENLGISFHRSLEDRHFSLPVFFRTDEVKPGKIIEIQCPAGLWGALQLTYEYTARLGYAVGEASPADRFAAQLTDFLGCTPIVHQYTDKATAPGATRYFIEKTRPRVRYWGIDRGVKMSDCNFIRHHTFTDLWTDDNLHALLAKTGNGITFDYPPHALFDQKATLALPFWSMTRAYFSDEIRNLFPYTTPLLPSGIELQDGTKITIEDFCRWSRSRRSYYLKLAGFNMEMNWGGRAVFRLSNMSSDACLNFLHDRLNEYDKGRIWLLQKEYTQDDEITYITRDGTDHTKNLRAKFNGFYGPAGCIGILAMHGVHNKVHGRDDTVVSYVLSDDEGQISA